MILSNQPPKGTADWFPAEFTIRKYIFDVWRRVCQSYGYEEYLTPLVEMADVYRAKSGEDVGGKELVTFTDPGGRELSIRPEMTPSVTRMVSQIYDSAPKPIRYFSVANFMRNEKPQRGRNREFWQLNVDLFGSTSIMADVEVASLAIEIMKAFNPPAQSFQFCCNHRDLINEVLDVAGVLPEQKLAVVRLLDKWQKLNLDDFQSGLKTLMVSESGIEKLTSFMACSSLDYLLTQMPELADNRGYLEAKQLMSLLTELGYADYITFKPSVIRGFDYYDGVVFEIFDNHPDNRRALFGGGRYNGLAGIFGRQSFPAVGFAPGDETLRIFLESWGLLETIAVEHKQPLVYLPVLNDGLVFEANKLAQKLRAAGQQVELSLEIVRLNKALEYANKKGVDQMIIFGESEQSVGIYKVKNMASGEEQEFPLVG